MRDGFIRLGDAITGGGKVTQASGFPSDGIPIALEHDKGFCALHGGEFDILGGNEFFIFHGRRTATEQLSKLACGCGLISSARAFLARVESPAQPRARYAEYAQPAAQPRIAEAFSTDASAFADATDVDPCGPLRRFTPDDIRVIQSYDPIKQAVIELPSSSSKSNELHPLRQKAAAALNRAGRELGSRSLCEHMGILNKVAVYMSVETVASAKAFVSRPPVFDMVINSEPFSRLWDGHKVGLMLHEVHHFSLQNRQAYEAQVADGRSMGTGTEYENDAYRFQRDVGFPATGTFPFDGLGSLQ